MRILRVASDLYPYVLGGIGIHAHDLSVEQSKQGNNVTVYTCPRKNIEKIKNEANNQSYFKSFFVRNLEVCGNPISFRMALYILINRKKYDIIHAHSHLFFPTNVCAFARRCGGSPLVITNHGTMSKAVPRWIQILYNHTLSVWTFNSADKVICYTEQAKKEMLSIGVKPEKIVIIHNGIYTDKFMTSHSSRISNEPHLIWVGRLGAGKGLKYLILGFELFLKSYPNAHLSIVGDGIYSSILTEYVRGHNLSKNIHILGNVDNEKIPELYAQANIMVFTSLSEGAPRVIYEAMASGLPIVSTDLPQLIDDVSQCGIIIPTRDANALNEALLRLASDEGLRLKCGMIGREIAQKSYSWKETTHKTTELFERIILDYQNK